MVTNLVFSSVTFSELFEGGLRDHLQAHYEELNDKAFPLKPDWDKYFTLENLGMLRCFACFNGSELVGYAIFLVSPNLHYSSSVWAMEDVYYLAPPYRKGLNGYKWLRFFLGEVEKSCDKVIMGTKLKLEIGSLLTRLGYKPFENLYTKLTNANTSANANANQESIGE